MKRDPVLAQLDFLINGPAPKASRADEEPEPEPPPPPPPPLLPPLDAQLPAPDPVLAQLDALINGAPPAPQATVVAAEPEEPRGPPGIFRECGGVRGWLAMRGYEDDHSTSPKRRTPTGAVAV
jgi:hypothetical protein